MAEVRLVGVSKSYDGKTQAVANVNLTVASGEFFTLLGPSGCGKTTTLRMVAGLEMPTEGEIWIGDQDRTFTHPRDRGVALVFQSYALYPHMTAFRNIGLNLKIDRVPSREIEARVSAIAATLQITHLLKRRPRNLSGGERQRIALARALVRNPSVLLMDEPLSNLDLKLREHMRTELRRLHDEYGNTAICVTHDQIEALTMSDRIAVMREGVVEQVGTPDEVYSRPANTFVATFVGTPSLNLMDGRLVGPCATPSQGELSAELGRVKVELRASATTAPSGRRVLVGIRPEDVLVCDGSESDAIRAIVRMVESIGASKLVFLDILEGELRTARMVAMVPGHEVFRQADKIHIRARPGRRMIFDDSTGRLIGFG